MRAISTCTSSIACQLKLVTPTLYHTPGAAPCEPAAMMPRVWTYGASPALKAISAFLSGRTGNADPAVSTTSAAAPSTTRNVWESAIDCGNTSCAAGRTRNAAKSNPTARFQSVQRRRSGLSLNLCQRADRVDGLGALPATGGKYLPRRLGQPEQRLFSDPSAG